MKRSTKAWTIGGALAGIVLFASAWAGGKYIINETKDTIVKPPLTKLICHVHDSISVKDRRMLMDANMQARKTQAYMEAWMSNPELIDAAKSRWHSDSAAYVRGLEDGR